MYCLHFFSPFPLPKAYLYSSNIKSLSISFYVWNSLYHWLLLPRLSVKIQFLPLIHYEKNKLHNFILVIIFIFVLCLSKLGELKLGELLDTPPPGLDEAIAISKACFRV